MKTTLPELKQNPDKTFVLTLTLVKDDIEKTYQHVLTEVQSDFEAKGFRKGKAPLDLVKSNISETKIIEEVLTHLISDVYAEKVKQYNLHPVIQPQIKVLNPPIIFNKDWEVEITGCELPQTELAPIYVEDIKKVNQGQEDANEKLNLTLDALVKHSIVVIPELLIKADIESKLSQLVDQTQQAGITVDQYLKTRNQTLEQYRENLQVQVKNEWIINLAIDKIARDQKLEVTPEEVKELIAKNQQLSSNPNLVYYLLTQQKVFDYLKKL